MDEGSAAAAAESSTLSIEERRQRMLQRLQQRRPPAAESSKKRGVTTAQSHYDRLLTSVGQLLDSAATSELADRSAIAKGAQDLQVELGDHSAYFTAYQIASLQKLFRRLDNTLARSSHQAATDSQFSFNSTRNDNAGGDDVDAANTTVDKAKIDDDVESLEIKSSATVSNRANDSIQLADVDLNGRDIVLRALRNCKVTLLGAPSTLHIDDVECCTIVVGPVASSVFVSDCRESVLVVACQQLRVHRSSALTCYMHITSGAIVEDCSDIGVAPYDLTYDTIDKHWALSALARNVNKWSEVADFNFPFPGLESPNWHAIKVEERHSGNWLDEEIPG